ncbi:MAG TPA: amine oxidase, partial [Dehalococcoidia bacterium]|nr:amine oxidase [Dehalococcoidia bacterium]
PSNIFEKITEGLTGEYRAKLTSVDYMSAILLILVLDRPLSNIYWLNVADRSIPFVGVIEHTNLIGASHYNGNHIVYLSNYLTPDNEYYRMNSDELLDAYLPHISKINPSFDRNWILDYHHHRIDGAQPIVGAYYSSRMPPHETGIDNLYLANTTQVYPEDRGTNYSVKMGREIALKADENLRLN